MKTMKLKLLILCILFVLPLVSATEISLIRTDPSPAVAGEYVDVTVRLGQGHLSTALDDVELTLEDSRFVTVLSSPVKYRTLLPNEDVTTTFRIFLADETPQGTINLEATLQAKEEGLTQFDIPLFVKDSQEKPDLRIGKIRTIPSVILPDTENNEMSLTLQNLGDRKAELITVTIIPKTDAFSEAFAYSLIDSLASLEGGEQKDLTFHFDVDTEGIEELSAALDLQYRIENTTGQPSEVVRKRLLFDIPLSDSPVLSVSKTEQVSAFEVGTVDNDVHLTITNSGTDTAEDVRVRLFPDITYPFVFDRTTRYISAELEPGQSAVVDFEVEVTDAAREREYPIVVEIESVVGTARYSKQETIMIGVSEKERALPISPAILVLILVIITSGVIGYLRIRKRKK